MGEDTGRKKFGQISLRTATSTRDDDLVLADKWKSR